MKDWWRHFSRPDRVQPICLDIYEWTEYRNCQFLFREGELFGCKAKGVRPSWAIQESENVAGYFLCALDDLLEHRNYSWNICSYRLKEIVIMSPLRIIINVVSAIIDLVLPFRE